MHTLLTRFAAAALLLSVAQIGLAGAPAGLPDNAAGGVSGSVTLVQAVPGRTVEMRVDGRAVHRVARAGDVIGPVRLPAGRHVFAFVGPGGGAARATVGLREGASLDVVLHRPEAVRGRSVVSSFSTPTRPIGVGRARILVADTATLVPADVRIDNRVVSANIANGASATVDVEAGVHRVALVPTGRPAPAVPARPCPPLRSAGAGKPPPATCTPGRSGWPATSVFGRSARDDPMTRHRTFTSLVLAVTTGVALVVLLGVLTPGPAD